MKTSATPARPASRRPDIDRRASRRPNRSGLLLLTAGLAAACSSAPPVQTDPEREVTGGQRRSGGMPSVESEVGALDPDAVSDVFKATQGALMACFESGSRRLPFLAGQIRLLVRVNATGGVSSAHMKSSSLGDRETEACMLEALRRKVWPRPQGGREGLAETEFTFDAPSNVRAPVDWDPADAGKNVAAARAELGNCKRKSGAGQLSATLYVQTDGTVTALGVGGADPAAEQAAACVVDALKDMKFNSPGSYAGKLVLTD